MKLKTVLSRLFIALLTEKMGSMDNNNRFLCKFVQTFRI